MLEICEGVWLVVFLGVECVCGLSELRNEVCWMILVKKDQSQS